MLPIIAQAAARVRVASLAQKIETDPRIVDTARYLAISIIKKTSRGLADDISSGTAMPRSDSSHNGDLVRETYKKSLEQLHILDDKGMLNPMLHGSEEERAVTRAALFLNVRNEMKLEARKLMPINEASLLDARNVAKYGNRAGMSLSQQLNKTLKDDPLADPTKIVNDIAAKSMKSTSKEHDEKFGLVYRPILLKGKSEVTNTYPEPTMGGPRNGK